MRVPEPSGGYGVILTAGRSRSGRTRPTRNRSTMADTARPSEHASRCGMTAATASGATSTTSYRATSSPLAGPYDHRVRRHPLRRADDEPAPRPQRRGLRRGHAARAASRRRDARLQPRRRHDGARHLRPRDREPPIRRGAPPRPDVPRRHDLRALDRARRAAQRAPPGPWRPRGGDDRENQRGEPVLSFRRSVLLPRRPPEGTRRERRPDAGTAARRAAGDRGFAVRGRAVRDAAPRRPRRAT